MTTKLTKYGIMIIAAVLLMTVVFAGAVVAPASASTTVTLNQNGADISSVPDEFSINLGDLYLPMAITNPIKTGNTFCGWYDSASILVITNESTISALNPSATYYDSSSGWIYTGGSGTLTLIAKWVPTKTTVNFWNESAKESKENTYGATTIKPADPTKTGYTFVGWNVSTGSGWAPFDSASYNNSGVWNYTGSAATLDVYANWSANKTTITLDKNGAQTASTPAYVTATYDSGDLDSSITNPIWPGYTFYGWYNDTAGEDNLVITNTSTLNTDGTYVVSSKWHYNAPTLTLYAKWVANKTTITFDKDGGDIEAPANMVFTHNASVTYKIDKYDGYKTGYVFKGWNVSGTDIMLYNAHDAYSYAQNGTENYIDDDYKWINTSANGSTIPLKAYWATITPTAITLKSGTTLGDQIIHATYNKSELQDTASLKNPTKYGNTFLGWSNKSDGESSGVIIINNTTQLQSGISGFTNDDGNWISTEAAVTLWANWSANATTAVTFNEMGGSSVVGETFTYGEEIPYFLNISERAGYEFQGWNVSTGSGWKVIADEFGITKKNVDGYITAGIWDNATSSIELYANWTPTTTIITLDENGGEAGSTTSVIAEFGNASLSSAIENPTRTGYTFNGWNLTETGTGDQVINATGKLVNCAGYVVGGKWNSTLSAVTLYANWSATNKSITPGDPINEKLVPADYGADVTLYKVEGISGSPITIVTDSGVAGEPANATRGYDLDAVYGTFQINGVTSSTVGTIILNITFTDPAENASIYLKHYKDSAWEAKHIVPSSITPLSSPANTYQYEFKVSEFSPFSVVLESPLSTEIWLDSTSNRFAAKFDCATLVPSTPEFGNPTKDGHTFIGWYNKTNGGIKVINVTRDLVTEATAYTTVDGLWNYTESSLTLFSNYTANVTNLEFYNETSTLFTCSTVTYGQPISFNTSIPVKEGYVFHGWNVTYGTDGWKQLFNETGYAVNSEPYTDYITDGKWTALFGNGSTLKLYAEWISAGSTITLNANGGTDGTTVVNTTYLGNVLDPTTLVNPTKKGYIFNGWFNETDGLGVLVITNDSKINTMPGYTDSFGRWTNTTSAFELYANWTPKTTKIDLREYVTNAHKDYVEATYNSSAITSIILDPSTSKPGYTFHGWYNKSNGGIPVINGTTKQLESEALGYITDGNWTYLSSTLDLFENFTANVVNLTFYNETGTLFTCLTVTYDQAITPNTSIPVKEGYTFKGWNFSIGSNTWVKMFNETGYSVPAETTTQYIRYNGIWNAPLTNGSTLKLVAEWEPVKSVITLNANGGTVGTATVTATYNSDVLDPSTLVNPTYPGYTFNGWYNETGGVGELIITNTSALVANVANYTTNAGKWINTTAAFELYANWTANVTDVTFDKNGGNTEMSPLTTTFTFNQTLAQYPYTGTNAGKHFEGWTYTDNIVNDPYVLFNDTGYANQTPGFIDADGKWIRTWANGTKMTLKADWAANVTFLNLSNDGVNYHTSKVTYMSNVVENKSVTEPTKPGFWFDGWFNQSEGGVRVLDHTSTYVALAVDVPGYTDADGNWINNSVANGSTIDLFAHWTPAETELELHKFDTNATTGTLTAHYGSTNITGTKQTPVLAGYVFHGWNNGSKSTGTPVLNISSELLANAGIYTDDARNWIYTEPTLLLFENFTANVTNVSFNPLGGSAVPNEYFTYNEPVPNVNVSYRPGYWFTSWNLSYDESWLQLFDRNATPIITNANYAYINELGNWSNTNLKDGEEITMDAQWTANKTTIILNATPYTTNVNPTSVVATFNETTGWNITNPTYTGYDFHGWYNKTNGEGERIIYVNGTLVPGIYNYTNDDGEWNNTVVADGDSIMFYAYWTANITQLNLSKNDVLGTTTDANPTLVNATYDSNVTVPNLTANPTKVGYTFMGWYDAPTAGIKVMENISNPLTFVHNDTIYTNATGYWKYPGENMSVVNLSAHWLANETVLVLNKNNSTETYNATPNNVTVTYDSSEVRPDTIVQANKTGYILLGWFNQSEGGVMVLDNSSEPQLVNAPGYVEGGVWKNATAFGAKIQLYAHWTPITYTVKFDANGGQGSMADMHFTYDEAPRALTANDFQRYNSNFMYWIANNTGIRYNNTEFVQNLTTVRDGIVIMTAQWQGYSTGSSNEATILNNTTVKKNTYTSSSSVSTYTPSSQSSFVSSTQTQTSTPAVTSVATPVATQAPVAIPTAPTTAATTKPTQKSPAPVVGLIAGLGAAALFLRLRK